jgi:hypothetical protein
MADKKLFLITGIFALCLPLAFAQEEETDVVIIDDTGQSNYYIYYGEEEVRFIQKLRWEGTDHVLHYEVIIQRMGQDGVFIELERIKTEESFIEVSLLAGKYRYMVRVFDYFEEHTSSTAWHEFEIIRALQPMLTGFSPSGFWFDETYIWEISLHGQHLLQESDIYLVQDDIKITPQSQKGEGESARLVFSETDLIAGQYTIYVRNPGGLETELGTFTIGFRKSFNINISLGYAPIVPLYGYLFNDTNIEAPFSGGFYPPGVSVSVSFIPFKRLWGAMGAEFSGSLTYLEDEKDFYTSKTSFLNAHLGFLYQRNLYRKTLTLNISMGAGITSLLGFQYEYIIGNPSESRTVFYPSVMAGFYLNYFVVRPYYITIGVDYFHMFSPQEDSPMPGFLRPFITFGIQL